MAGIISEVELGAKGGMKDELSESLREWCHVGLV